MKKLLLFSLIIVAMIGKSQEVAEYDDYYVYNSLIFTEKGAQVATQNGTLFYYDNGEDSTGLYFDDGVTLHKLRQGAEVWEETATGIKYTAGTVEVDNGQVILDTIGFYIGQEITWNTEQRTIDIPTGSGSVIQAGRELQINVYNDSGDTIKNGKAVYPCGNFNGTGTICLARSDSHETIGVDYGVTTVDIPNNSYGDVVWFGRATLNTSAWSLGDTLYISPTQAGELTNVMPTFADYAIPIAFVEKVGVSDGVIFVTSRSTPFDSFRNFHNGTFRETFDFLITESGGVVTGTLTPSNGHPNMTMLFSDGLGTFITTPPATITLTPGTDTNPQTNYVYVPRSTKALTVSTSAFPETEHIKVAQVVLQSAATTGINGALRNQNINDAIQSTNTNQGHLSHIGERIRAINAQWDSGAEATLTGTPTDLYISTTEGRVYQMHLQVFAAQNMATGDDIHIVNDPISPYRTTTNLNDIDSYSTGLSWNNEWSNIVVWGVCNKSGEISHLMCNLPSGGYNSEENAINDGLNYSDYTIPRDFNGVGFLIGRFTFRISGGSFTYNSGTGYLDLRGTYPSTSAGGGGSSGITTFLGLTDTPSGYTANGLVVANSGATALENTNNLVYDNTTERLGLGTATPLAALHLNTGYGTITNGLMFNNNEGIYQPSTGIFNIQISGALRGQFSGSGFGFGSSARPFMSYSASTATSAVFRIKSGDTDTGIGGDSGAEDQVSFVAGGKEIARAYEDIAEQFIVNPQGDLTGTAANPSLAFGGGGVPNTGFYESVDNNLLFASNGVARFSFGNQGFVSIELKGAALFNKTTTATIPTLVPNRSDTGSGIGQNNTNELSFIANSTEGVRITQDTTFINNYLKFESGASLEGLTTASQTLFGTDAGAGLTSGVENVMVGEKAGFATTSGISNTFVGDNAGLANITGGNNVAVGRFSGYAGMGTGTSNNVFVGYSAAYSATGSSTVAIGTSAGRVSTGNGVYIGDNAGRYETGSNKLFIDNQTRTDEADGRVKALIYGEFASATADQLVRINGKLEVAETFTSNGVMSVESVSVDYTNTTQTTVITLPAGSVVWETTVRVTTAFDGTDPKIELGTTADPDLFFSYPAGSTGDFNYPANNFFDSETDIKIQVTGSGMTTGEATVYIHYTKH